MPVWENKSATQLGHINTTARCLPKRSQNAAATTKCFCLRVRTITYPPSEHWGYWAFTCLVQQRRNCFWLEKNLQWLTVGFEQHDFSPSPHEDKSLLTIKTVKIEVVKKWNLQCISLSSLSNTYHQGHDREPHCWDENPHSTRRELTLFTVLLL